MGSAKKLLQEKAEQVTIATEVIVAKTSDWQVIQSFLSNKTKIDKLTPTQQKKLERYQYIYNQLASFKYTETEVVNQVTHLYNIEYVQAYEDLNCTREIFSTVLNINKAFELKMLLEAAKKAIIKCDSVQDFKTSALYQKNMIVLLNLLQDAEPNQALFEGHTIEADFNPSLLGGPKIKKDDMLDLMNRINVKRGKKISIDDAIFYDVQ